MRYRFIGQHTGGRTSITVFGVTFEAREPAEVTCPDGLRRLANHGEFQAIDPLDHDGDGHKGGSLPKRRGRPRKVDGA